MTALALRTLRVEAALYTRDLASLFFAFVFPLLLLALNARQTGTVELDGRTVPGADLLVPSLLAMTLVINSVGIVPGTMARYRESGVLRRLRTTPLPPVVLLASTAAVSLGTSLLAAAVLVAVGAAAFDLPLPASPAAAVATLLVTATGTVLLSLLLAALPLSARETEAAAFVAVFPLIFLSGAVGYRPGLPEAAQRIGDVLPVTWAVDALQHAWTTGGMAWSPLAGVAGAGLVALAAAARFFRWE